MADEGRPDMGRQSLRELQKKGKSLRSSLPRRGHAELSLPDRDPVGLIAGQNESRLADLVPVRIGRMLQSPFAYYRGTAAVMAHDLAAAAVTGQRVVCCGDAHISNFGLFASPERRLLFDLNDFDEVSTAPWEWDVKRFAASVVIGGRDIGLTETACFDSATSAVSAYRTVLRELYSRTALERYFFQVETDMLEKLASPERRKLLTQTAKKARRRTSDQVLDKLVMVDDHGQRVIKDDPPIARHIANVELDAFQDLFAQYYRSMRPDTALLLSQFRLVDFILRVVGVGSVGTRCFVLLLVGPAGEPLFLQAKEAPPSVLESHGREPLLIRDRQSRMNQGERVVTGQRVLQAQSDPFLGWIESWGEAGGEPTDFYLRQFRDMKGSVDLTTLTGPEFQDYGRLCAAVLARAHSQSPDAAVIYGYLGRSDQFELAVAKWAVQYADQAEKDYNDLKSSVEHGRLRAEYGV
jgi:uncharacterized protein (DUF2252 family)